MKFDPVAYVNEKYDDLRMMRSADGKRFSELLEEHDCKKCLELGFNQGKSSAYIAATLKALGRGHLTTIDMHYAEAREPNIGKVMSDLDLEDWITYHYENQSYTWRLMKFIEEERTFDFCYIDGGHVWDVTGYGFCLVDRLIPVGGLVIFDDLDWTIKGGIPAERLPKYPDPAFTEEFINTEQARKVFDLLVAGSGKYDCSEWKAFGIAKKVKA
jgi:predicted O-methyltransferase YrrM